MMPVLSCLQALFRSQCDTTCEHFVNAGEHWRSYGKPNPYSSFDRDIDSRRFGSDLPGLFRQQPEPGLSSPLSVDDKRPRQASEAREIGCPRAPASSSLSQGLGLK